MNCCFEAICENSIKIKLTKGVYIDMQQMKQTSELSFKTFTLLGALLCACILLKLFTTSIHLKTTNSCSSSSPRLLAVSILQSPELRVLTKRHCLEMSRLCGLQRRTSPDAGSLLHCSRTSKSFFFDGSILYF